ncbi:MAG TPA: hypothetical protein VI072_23315 [Polyangiaceae bacterium]
MRLLTRLALLFALLSSARPASAQPALDLRNFRPPTDPRGSLYLEPSTTPGPGAWNVGAWFSYAHRQIVVEGLDGGTRVPLEHQLSLDYLASVGLGEQLALGLTLPTVLYQSGDDIRPLASDSALPRTAIGDLGFTAKASLLAPGELGGFGLGAIARVTTPTGDTSSYLGEEAVSGELRVLAELRLIALDVRATAGARVRGLEQTYLGEEFGNDLPWGFSVSLRPQVLGLDDRGRWIWTLETRGAVSITPDMATSDQSPALYAASARYSVGQVSAIAGVELPITDAVGSPSVRVVAGIGWAPRFEDADKDGVEDEKDECPELAEDRDGFEDSDGCPDWDNDDDGVGDEDDRCPTQQEDEDEVDDDDGCPEPPGKAAAKAGNGPDGDGDAIPDARDECADAPEDADEFEDEDGCPDLDNDRDGVEDEDDACPMQAGPRRDDAKLSGCPSPDGDLDTFDDSEDQCPKEREDFDGDRDLDGCPDAAVAGGAQRNAPLLAIQQKGHELSLQARVTPAFVAGAQSTELAPASLPLMRALAAELNQHPTWVVLVGVRPSANAPDAEQEALNRSFAIVHALRSFTHRDEAAESVGFAAVRDQPGARASGVGWLLLAPRDATAAPKKP